MFLIWMGTISFHSVLNTVNCIFSWLDDHAGIIGIIVGIIAGSLWSYKFLMQKRKEAFFGFYTRLYFQLKSLETSLKEKKLLEIDSPNEGNIYSLLYIVDVRKEACEDFQEPSGIFFDDIKNLALQIKETLTESESNVYPNASEREEWYKNQFIIFEFCEFLEYDSKRQKTNKTKFKDNDKDYKHTIKCKELVNAINFIKNSINKAITGRKHSAKNTLRKKLSPYFKSPKYILTVFHSIKG